MKNRLINVVVILGLFSQTASADGWGNLGRALGDTVTLGQAGRERDEEFAKKQLEIAALNRKNLVQQRNTEIDRLNSNISAAMTSYNILLKNKTEYQKVLEGLDNFYNLSKQGATTAVSIDSLTQNSAAAADEMSKDLVALQFLINQISNPDTFQKVLQILASNVQARGLSVQDFIKRTLEYSKLSQEKFINLSEKITTLLPLFVALQAQQDAYVQQQQEIIHTNSMQLKALQDAISGEKAAAEAAAKAEQDRINKEQAAVRRSENAELKEKLTAAQMKMRN